MKSYNRLKADACNAFRNLKYKRELVAAAAAQLADAKAEEDKARATYAQAVLNVTEVEGVISRALAGVHNAKSLSAKARYEYAKSCMRLLGVSYYSDATTKGRSIKLDYIGSCRTHAVIKKAMQVLCDKVNEGISLDFQSNRTEYIRYHFYTGCSNPELFSRKNKRRRERRRSK